MFDISLRRLAALFGAVALLIAAAPAVSAGQTGPTDDSDRGSDRGGALTRDDPSDRLEAHDAAAASMTSAGSSQSVSKNLAIAGRGERAVANATTDVWSLGKYAYIGTFNTPCGTGEGFVTGVGEVDLVDGVEQPGIAIFDIHNPNHPGYVGNLPSVEGSRTNDVKVTALNSGDVLAHSNEACGGGPGGIELYDVDDPTAPVHLSSIRVDEINPISNALLGGVSDAGVHNIWLFSQDDRDYVSIVAETGFDNFRTYDITDPTAPTLVSAWGAEEVFDPGVGDEATDAARVLDALLWLLDGFGTSANRFLHDITINAEGTRAYLSNWDAGLILLDISDPADPQLVSVALDPAEGSLDGEVNSHAAWPSEDGSVVVESEEDFDAFEPLFPPGNFTFGNEDDNNPGDTGTAPLPGTAISTIAGDDFEANPTGNAGTADGGSLTVDSGPLAGETYTASELSGDQPKFADTGPISGAIVFVGRACDGDTILNAGQFTTGTEIAVVRRGACTFREKNFNVAAAGADVIVIANNLTEATPWGGLRIWDYSDPANPVLASTFNTECSASAVPTDECVVEGTYSVHNVQVETRGNRTFAYVSWYWDGMLVLDVTDPSDPVKVAHFKDTSDEFIAANGGQPHDFWGVYKQSREPWILASDRNGGLYVFKELGRGSGPN